MVQPEEGQQHPLLLSRQAPGHCQADHQINTEQAGISRRDVLLWLVQGHRCGRLIARGKVLRQAFGQLTDVFDRLLSHPLVAIQANARQTQKFANSLGAKARQGVEHSRTEA